MGLTVTTSDGARLGTVREISGSYFKVDAPMHRDYWLSGALVRDQDEATVTLEVPQDRVAEYRRTEPGVEPGDDPFENFGGKEVLTADEMLEQRANMERELAQQSRDLPPHEPSITEMRGPRGYERIPADHTGFGDLAGGYVPNAPVQDAIRERDFTLTERKGSMVVPVVVLAGAAAVAFTVIMFMRRRHHHRERIRDHAAAAARLASERTRDIAKHEGNKARRMLARRGASLARRVEERLERAA
jgi:hypothetical protein